MSHYRAKGSIDLGLGGVLRVSTLFFRAESGRRTDGEWRQTLNTWKSPWTPTLRA